MQSLLFIDRRLLLFLLQFLNGKGLWAILLLLRWYFLVVRWSLWSLGNDVEFHEFADALLLQLLPPLLHLLQPLALLTHLLPHLLQCLLLLIQQPPVEHLLYLLPLLLLPPQSSQYFPLPSQSFTYVSLSHSLTLPNLLSLLLDFLQFPRVELTPHALVLFIFLQQRLC